MMYSVVEEVYIKYLYDYAISPCYVYGLLRELFETEIVESNYENIQVDSTDYVNMTKTNQFAVINDKYFILNDLDSFYVRKNKLYIQITHNEEKEIINVEIKDLELLKNDRFNFGYGT